MSGVTLTSTASGGEGEGGGRRKGEGRRRGEGREEGEGEERRREGREERFSSKGSDVCLVTHSH